MEKLQVRLFGRPRVSYAGRDLEEYRSSKSRVLLYFLLINRNRPVSRESLATILCGGNGHSDQARHHLRNALWGLRSELAVEDFPLEEILQVDREWIEVRTTARVWLDIDVFRAAARTARSLDGRLDESGAKSLADAADLYTDPLLPNIESDWCTKERAKLHRTNLFLLDKLSGFHERTETFGKAVAYAERILDWEPAHERTHRRLMKLYLRMGDRTSALRQFERCNTALREELDVPPETKTLVLYERIRSSERPGESDDANPWMRKTRDQLG